MTLPPGPLLLLIGLVIAIPKARRPSTGATGFFEGLLPALLAATLVGSLELGTRLAVPFWDTELILIEVTRLRLVFAWAFVIALFLWSLYAWRLRDGAERGAGIAYAGSALGVVFAGDLLTLFLFWEAMAIASTIVVLRGRTIEASKAGFRYLLVHLGGGVVLLSGIGLHYAATRSLAFGPIPLEGAGPWLIFAGFAVNAAAWPVSAWLPDAYPAASPTGTVLLGTFTTKTAVYVLVAAFAGADALLVLGGLMAAYGVIYALGTRDPRRLLAYSLVGQVGFMLCAAGAGGDLGVAAAAAHAFMHVIYKSLLFMSAGVALAATGSRQGGQHAGLWRHLPYAALFGLVGAIAISAVPGTNGYASKSLIFEALHQRSSDLAGLVTSLLLVASAAAPLYVGLRFPWLAFSGRKGEDSAPPVREPVAFSARLGMGLAAALCLVLGVFPSLLLDQLPVHGEVHVFAGAHVIQQLLLLAAGVVAFAIWVAVARRSRVAGTARRGFPDTDRIWRGAGRGFLALATGPLASFFARLSALGNERLPAVAGYLARNPAGAARLGFERVRLGLAGLVATGEGIDRAQGRFDRALERYRATGAGQPWPIGRTTLYLALLLALYVVLRLVP